MADDPSPRRRYDSPVRRAQLANTRDRILDAGCELAHEFKSWDWRPMTVRAVAERAGVSERTVFRHFATEQALHHAVMQRLGEQSGVDYDALTLDDVAKTGAKVFVSFTSFEAPTWHEPEEGEFLAEDKRRQSALLAAVTETRPDWTEDQCVRAAAALDVLWSPPSYQRLATAWNLGTDHATEVIDWLIELVVDTIRTAPAEPKPRSRSRSKRA